MDIIDVLTAISKRKKALFHGGINEREALIKAELDVSEEYHISLIDVKKLIKTWTTEAFFMASCSFFITSE